MNTTAPLTTTTAAAVQNALVNQEIHPSGARIYAGKTCGQTKREARESFDE